MDVFFANKFSIAMNDSQAFLRFGCDIPVFSDDGELTEKHTESVNNIVITREGVEALKSLLVQLTEEKSEQAEG